MAQSHAHLRCESRRRWTGQPVRGHAGRNVSPAVECLAFKVEVDLQSIRFDALDSERFMERGSPYLEIGMPYSGRILLFGRNRERVESVLRACVDLLCVELSLRRSIMTSQERKSAASTAV